MTGASLEPPLHPFSPGRRIAAEALGTALLLAMVVGSGIMGERLAGGNAAVALLGNTLATGAGLVVLITIFGPLSGAHFNPAVTLVFALRREIGWRLARRLRRRAARRRACSGSGRRTPCSPSRFGRSRPSCARDRRQAFAEFVATFGLVAAILGSIRFRPEATPMVVGLYIASAYWFTASTSFANPAVTIARSLSDTFAGIAPASAPAFILAQLAGALAASALFGWLLRERTPSFGGGTPV